MGFIADPVIGLAQEGSVLDVQVFATGGVSIRTVRRRAHLALLGLTGAKLPLRKGVWARWALEPRTPTRTHSVPPTR